jgi:hypothetical protein
MWCLIITNSVSSERDPVYLNVDWIQYLTRNGRDLLIVG